MYFRTNVVGTPWGSAFEDDPRGIGSANLPGLARPAARGQAGVNAWMSTAAARCCGSRPTRVAVRLRMPEGGRRRALRRSRASATSPSTPSTGLGAQGLAGRGPWALRRFTAARQPVDLPLTMSTTRGDEVPPPRTVAPGPRPRLACRPAGSRRRTRAVRFPGLGGRGFVGRGGSRGRRASAATAVAFRGPRARPDSSRKHGGFSALTALPPRPSRAVAPRGPPGG